MAASSALAPALWFRSRWERLNGPARIAGVDLARSLAVFGMLAAHLVVIAPGSAGEIVHGRSSILFATLAGVSIGLATGGTHPVTFAARRVARLRLAVRAGLVWLVGIALILTGVPVVVILPAYAILFLVATALIGLRARTLFLLAAATATGMPLLVAWVQQWLDQASDPAGLWLELGQAVLGWQYPFVLWICFIAAGLGCARAGIRRLGVQLAMLGTGSGLALLGYGLALLFPAAGDSVLARVWTADPHSSGALEAAGSGGFALAVLALCLLVSRTPVRYLLLPLRAVGSMPLTAYTAQILIWALVAAVAFGDTSDLAAAVALNLFIPFTVGLILACTAWALMIGQGPLEWGMTRLAQLVVPDRAGGVGRLDE